MLNSQISEVTVARDVMAMIDREEVKRSPISPRSTFIPSDVTECPRRIFYRIMGTVEETPESYLQRMDHNSVVDKWTSMLSSIRGIKVTGIKVLFSDCHYNMTCYVDCILEIDSSIYVAIIKSVDEKMFEKIVKNGGIRKHVMELMIHLWLTERANGLLFYENNATLDYIVFNVSPHKPIINSARKKFLVLMDSRKRNELPIRPYDTIDSKECSLCEFKIRCWETDYNISSEGNRQGNE